MKSAELREMNINELDLKLTEFQEILFRYRFQAAMGQLDAPIRMRTARRNIARIKTILNEKKTTTEK